MIPSDTIFALSSGRGRSGVAVIRVTGPQSRTALRELSGLVPEPRRVRLSLLQGSGGEPIDQALVLYIQGPASATGEDMAEFHVHGSTAVVERLLFELSRVPGCRAAQPGEFTRRAFENEKLDLVEMEGLADLLNSETEVQRKLAMKQFMGEASAIYEGWRLRLIEAQATIEAAIDFPDEHGVAGDAERALRQRIVALRSDLQGALEKAAAATAVRRGLTIVVAGPPNSGKSSLVNALIGRDVSIVSPVAGTTRDVVSETLIVAGVPVRVADTAGLRAEAADDIEREGMARTATEVAGADVLVWVQSVADREASTPPRRPEVQVLSKHDLRPTDPIRNRNNFIAVSAKTGTGISDLRGRLEELVAERLSSSRDGTMVRVRHAEAVAMAVTLLDLALAELTGNLEIAAENMRKAGKALAGITGAVGAEDWLGRIYAEFCIGK
jgi:tRNA modification GTPase